MRRIILAVAIASVCAGAAFAQDGEPVAAGLEACVANSGASRVALEACRGVIFDPCIDTDGGETTYGMVQCYSAEGRAWTALLDAAVGRGMADEARRVWLSSAQQAWIAWREAECAYRASLFLGGSMARVLSAACYADLTAARAIDLIHAERTVE